MSGFGKRIDGPGGRRRTQRQQVQLAGTATSLHDTRSVLVEDVSWTGAKVFGRGLPLPGKEVLIRAGERVLFGRVRWAKQDRRGIIF
jgi:hypothetical protein